MNIKEAQQNIGQPFKVKALHGGLAGSFDIIKEVQADGIIIGDFIEAHCEDCRLKETQPDQLHTYQISKNHKS